MTSPIPQPRPWTIGVYCSSSSRVSPDVLRLAESVGRAIAERGWQVVYGGTTTGSMLSLANGARDAGGMVVGVIPRFMANLGLAEQGLAELHIVETMRERKSLIEELSDAFVVLPGGLGTIEELMEILVLKQLHQSRAPLVLLNHEGTWDSLVALFDELIARGLARPSTHQLYAVAATIEEALDLISTPDESLPAESKW